jgi:hypothetical protein
MGTHSRIYLSAEVNSVAGRLASRLDFFEKVKNGI